MLYGDLRSWLSIDMKVMNKLDPTQPTKFTGSFRRRRPQPTRGLRRTSRIAVVY